MEEIFQTENFAAYFVKEIVLFQHFWVHKYKIVFVFALWISKILIKMQKFQTLGQLNFLKKGASDVPEDSITENFRD